MTSHDVRHLGTCALCHEIGTHEPRLSEIALLLTLRSGHGKRAQNGRVGAHPRCLVRYDKNRAGDANADIAFITKLGVEEMGKIRRDDLPDVLYRRLIIAHDTQARAAEGKGP